MQLKVLVEWDVESTPLEIRTNSVLGSNEMVHVTFYSAEEEYAGLFRLHFTSTLKYYFGWCNTTFPNLPVTPPSANDKVWRITLTRTAGVRLVIIHCNDVEVLNTLVSQATCSDSYKLKEVWSRDVTKIKFSSSDTASDYYKAGD